MIVMKFGGSSVESAAAIERVASIVKARVERQARGGGLGHGQDHQQAAGDRAELHRAASGTRPWRSSRTCGRSTCGKPGRSFWTPTGPRPSASSTEHFQELTELVKGFAVLGELSPRSVDAISSYGERLSSALVALAFRKFGMDSVHFDSRAGHDHRRAATRRPRRFTR